ncbi:MAG: DNA mismatch repair protein MutS [Deltaproteobacteria bacterium]|nr:DNA mismatch repair protein MutS [Deltaproteobacteria bacterium]
MAEVQAQVDRISNLRLVTGLAGAGLGVAVWREALVGSWLLVPLVAFVGLVLWHERTHRALEAAKRAVAHYRAGLRRIDDTWMGRGFGGESLRPEDHPYAADLDVLGEGSLFELLCTARTGAGQQRLATWLLAASPLPELRARQAAVEALRQRLDLREALDLAGDRFDAELDPTMVVAWGAAPATMAPPSARRWGLVAWVVPAASLVAMAAWIWGGWGPGPFAGLLLVTWVVGRATRGFVRRAHLSAERSALQLSALARVLGCLEAEDFDDPTLHALHTTLVSGRSSASTSIRRLARLLAWAEAARGQLFSPIAFALLWSLHFSIAIERWRQAHGPAIEGWLDALGRLEALASLSAFAYEHPEDPFAELVDDQVGLDGQQLGHPLLPATQCVRNSITLDASVRACIVSGSNMSGKSTYLRTIGINVVLGLAGAPVRAERLRMSALRIGATLRVQDSLQTGTSRFFAEITRLRSVVADAEAGPGVLFLLDEILHGTNSNDRREGGHAVVQGLLAKGAVGLVTTHDLALATDNDDPRIINVHFCDELRDGQLHFDYRLREGVVRTSNALALMAAVGLPVGDAQASSQAVE